MEATRADLKMMLLLESFSRVYVLLDLFQN
jgi:hypothetical protein